MGVGRIASGVGLIGSYVIAPVLVAVITNGVSEHSVGGRILDAIYPKQVSSQIVDKKPLILPPSQGAVVDPALTTAAPAAPLQKPVALADAPQSTPMAVTPENSPVQGAINAPVVVNHERFSAIVTLKSTVDALPIFAAENSYLEGWSATVQPSNVSCRGGGRELSGMRSYRGEDWRRAGDDISKLPKGVPVQIGDEFVCQGEIKAGDTVTTTIRLNYVIDGVRTPITFYSPAIQLKARYGYPAGGRMGSQ